MIVGSSQSREAVGNVQTIPSQVRDLWPGEREVASIVFARGPSTAVEVRARMTRRLSASAVRTTLNRLVAKNILECRAGRRGRGQAAVYCPAEIPEHARKKAIAKVAVDYFGGSPVSLAIAALQAAGELNGDVKELALEIAARFGSQEQRL